MELTYSMTPQIQHPMVLKVPFIYPLMLLNIIACLLCPRYNTRNFTYVTSSSLHRNSARGVTSSFYKWESWAQRLSNLPTSRQRERQEVTLARAPSPIPCCPLPSGVPGFNSFISIIPCISTMLVSPMPRCMNHICI